MKLRTKILLALVLLSVVPLSGVVFFSYLSSQQALREAVEAEAEVLAAEISERLQEVRVDLDRRIRALSTVRLQALAIDGQGPDLSILSKVVEAIGDAAPLFRSLEFLPRDTEGGDSRGVTVLLAADKDNEGECEAVVVDHRRPTMQRRFRYSRGPHPVLLAEQALELVMAAVPEAKVGLTEPVPETSEALKRSPISASLPPDVRRHLKDIRRRFFSEGLSAGRHRADLRLVASEKLVCELWEGDRMIGKVRAEIDPEALLQKVLSATLREKGEIPFAVDAELNVFTAEPADKEILAEIPLAAIVANSGSGATVAVGNWVVVTNEDPQSGITLGIARPVGKPLSDLRLAAVRNLSYGLGMIGFALLGILPLSRKMTHNLSRLSAGVEQLGAGDLGARVALSGKDEIGTLAKSFNRMAAQLEDNQKRLVEEERLRKEQEMRQQFLEAEHARKSAELEQARQFQLSLLPRQLPTDPRYQVAVLMRTATEVGGDYYDFCHAPDHSLMLAIGDAIGHGATAGTMVTVVKSLFTASSGHLDPGAFLSSASNAICRMHLGRMNMALCLARFEAHSMVVSAAGMPPVLLHRPGSGDVSEVSFEALPLGAMSDLSYEERRVELGSGDTLLFMTDGFPELLNPQGELLGYARVSDIVRTSAGDGPEELLRSLENAANQWVGDGTLQDDFTFVAVRVSES